MTRGSLESKMHSKPGFTKSRSFEIIDFSKDPGNLKVQIF